MGKKYEPMHIDKLNLGNYVNCNSFELICQYSVDFSCIKIISTIKVGHSILAIRTLNFYLFTWCVMFVFIKHTKNISWTSPKKMKKCQNLPNSKNDLRFNLAVLKNPFIGNPDSNNLDISVKLRFTFFWGEGQNIKKIKILIIFISSMFCTKRLYVIGHVFWEKKIFFF